MSRTISNITVYIAIALALVASVFGGAVLQAQTSQAETMAEVRSYIRANGGIPPCIYEDGSGQPGKCFWDAPRRGNGTGRSFVAVPTMPGHDKRIVYLSKN